MSKGTMIRWVGERPDGAAHPAGPRRPDVPTRDPTGAPTVPRRRPTASQAEALSVADERRDDTGLDLNVYRCDFCSGWHMGSAEGRR